MSSIKNMMKQANPEADQKTGTRSAPPQKAANTPGSNEAGSNPKPLNLPPPVALEERKPLSTRLRPSLKKMLEAYVLEIREAGFPATQELVLDALLRELQRDDTLRERIAQMVVNDTRGGV